MRPPDLIKADTPLTPAKISRMLHQLDFKLTVEKQYKEGIEKMVRLYQVRRPATMVLCCVVLMRHAA